jgi:Translation initiation factor eIF3 subunit 135
MLFRPQQELANFSISELFKNQEVASALHQIEKPVSLNLKPEELYTKIKHIALARYRHALPDTQIELKCLQNPNNKLSLLRDICIKLGIKIVTHETKEFILDNDQNILQNKLQFQANKLIN